MTPTLAAACAALPAEGVEPALGRPGGGSTSTLAPASIAAQPALMFPPELLLAAQGIRAAFFDVDGVLTDGGLYLSEQGESLKRFHILDGLGFKLLQRAGIAPVVITGRDSAPLRARLAALGVTEAHYGVDDKSLVARAALDRLGLDWLQAAAIGDDWPDLPVLRRCAFSAAPANAHAEVKAVVRYVTTLAGGQGAAREFCDLLLIAGGRYAGLLETFA